MSVVSCQHKVARINEKNDDYENPNEWWSALMENDEVLGSWFFVLGLTAGNDRRRKELRANGVMDRNEMQKELAQLAHKTNVVGVK